MTDGKSKSKTKTNGSGSKEEKGKEKGKKGKGRNLPKHKEKVKEIRKLKKKKPTYNVPNAGVKKRVKERWRRPRGIDNKKRIKLKAFGALPKIGYRNPKSLRGLHPIGYPEVLVHNPKELEGLKEVAVRIASSVGKRKRAEIIAKAKELNLPVLNPKG